MSVAKIAFRDSADGPSVSRIDGDLKLVGGGPLAACLNKELMLPRSIKYRIRIYQYYK